jgi:hypothetical protein
MGEEKGERLQLGNERRLQGCGVWWGKVTKLRAVSEWDSAITTKACSMRMALYAERERPLNSAGCPAREMWCGLRGVRERPFDRGGNRITGCRH